MGPRPQVPPPFRALTELSADALGAFVLHATDDYFAPKENLLKPGAPEWREGEYTDKGKWMDGWESQRRREEGHDVALIRLGAPGRVRGAVIDTTHFKGNAPQEILLEGIEAPDTATASELPALEGWTELIPKSPVKPDTVNVFSLEAPSRRTTHVRLHIYPDGGVSRLRIYGDVLADPRRFYASGSVDLAALENGATIASANDEFFGPPLNLLLPGRGVNMGDGWETRRRRTPGSDWTVVKLARRGVIERVELDTHFFKGNAPQATLLEALDATELSAEALDAHLRGGPGWKPLIDRTPLVQHRRHHLEPARPLPVTHVRVHIFPHGGVNRLRLQGYALDTPEEASALARFNQLQGARLHSLLSSFCGSTRWAEELTRARPVPNIRALFSLADSVWWGLGPKDWLEAFAAHPKIGQKKKAAAQSQQSARWSRGEQGQVAQSPAEVLAELAALNEQYFKKFGFIFIVCASGKSAPEMLRLLRERVRRTKGQELETAAREQALITRLRVEKWLRNAET